MSGGVQAGGRGYGLLGVTESQPPGRSNRERVPSPSSPRKPSGFGREGGGVPSSFWPLDSLAAP